jgi:hypothetical protein
MILISRDRGTPSSIAGMSALRAVGSAETFEQEEANEISPVA